MFRTRLEAAAAAGAGAGEARLGTVAEEELAGDVPVPERKADREELPPLLPPPKSFE